MSDNTEKQNDEQHVRPKPVWLEPYHFKAGQSGNPKGRPVGKTLKEWTREKIMEMPDEERIAFLKRLPAEIIWRMAEGNPHSTEDVRHTVAPTPIMKIEDVKIDNTLITTPDSEPRAVGHASGETPSA